MQAILALLTEVFNAITLNKWKKSQDQVQRVFAGSVVELLKDEKKLMIMEHGVDESSISKYGIPVQNVSEYELGQKLEVTVYSNELDRTWSLEQGRFEVKAI
ncbi:hypothetical protein [Pontibacillus marinus]|uniref:Uncharacterized protein n=1 Tax=Pontibacillus marinus BH030004 = DSM 16465 TaxID=1385511 RepID=A0A0A5HPA5_9BACI|nr:hypothetical protein [Pontibacillus marinus]KGX85447.1 hypothetical protein N783_14610 [Pontibacillus marinus BH030004 = DSM 16465]